MSESAEYQALERVITADKRYRKFVYLLTIILFVLVIAGGFLIQNTIINNINDKFAAGVERANKRQEDNRTIARETIRYNTCLLVIDPTERTIDVQDRCFAAADLKGGLTRADFSPIVLSNVGSKTAEVPAQPVASSSGVNSSPNTTPPPQQSQPDTSQPDNRSIAQMLLDWLNPRH